eukprot:TRINITY_DN2936_c0_g1_i2.p1 TRINITY_DN2936_c0_g1~~TRINITY_DN2936_c0_g1_i2.p1  ORF type:complete len:350 (-),score=108.07 TRINITY_DN2936_c0_g1_i2:969-2018(-)
MDASWIFETVFAYLNSPSFEEPISKWVENHSKSFLGVELNSIHTHEQYILFQEYVKFIDNVVGGFLTEIGVDQATFFETCLLLVNEEQSPARLRLLISQILYRFNVICEFENFKKLMILFALQITPTGDDKSYTQSIDNDESFFLLSESIEQENAKVVSIFEPPPTAIKNFHNDVFEVSYEDEVDEIFRMHNSANPTHDEISDREHNVDLNSKTPDSLDGLCSSDGESPKQSEMSMNGSTFAPIQSLKPLKVSKLNEEKGNKVQNLDDLLNAMEEQNISNSNLADDILGLFESKGDPSNTFNFNSELENVALKPILSEGPKLKGVEALEERSRQAQLEDLRNKYLNRSK